MATKPNPKLCKNSKGEETGFCREMKYLESKGYKYDFRTSKMIKKD